MNTIFNYCSRLRKLFQTSILGSLLQIFCDICKKGCHFCSGWYTINLCLDHKWLLHDVCCSQARQEVVYLSRRFVLNSFLMDNSKLWKIHMMVVDHLLIYWSSQCSCEGVESLSERTLHLVVAHDLTCNPHISSKLHCLKKNFKWEGRKVAFKPS